MGLKHTVFFFMEVVVNGNMLRKVTENVGCLFGRNLEMDYLV